MARNLSARVSFITPVVGGPLRRAGVSENVRAPPASATCKAWWLIIGGCLAAAASRGLIDGLI